MIKLHGLKKAHYPVLYRTALIAENSDIEYNLFKELISQRIGWSVFDDDKIIGCLTYSDYVPNINMLLHCSIHPAYHGKWLSRRVINSLFSLPFVEFGVHRLSAFCIKNDNDYVGGLLERLGFKQEGIAKEAAFKNNKWFDVICFGILKHECKWIKEF